MFIFRPSFGVPFSSTSNICSAPWIFVIVLHAHAEYSEKPGWGILLFAFVVVVCLLFRTGVLWVALDQVGLTHKVSWFLPPECLD